MRIGRLNRWVLTGGVALVVAATFVVGAVYVSMTRSDSGDTEMAYRPVDPAQYEPIVFTQPVDPKVLFIGDSVAEPYARIFTNYKGWDSVFSGARGLQWAAVPGKIQEARRASSPQPNVVVLHAGLSDMTTEAEALAATVRDSVDLARETWPGAEIIIFGPFIPRAANSDLAATSARIQIAALVKRAPFIDPVGQRWFSAQNSGRFSTDNSETTLNADGNEYVAERLAQNLSAYTEGK